MNTQYLTNSRTRTVVLTGTLLLLTFVLVRLLHVDGLLRRVTIDGPSMAPAWCGSHFEVRCSDCGFAFRGDAEHVPSDGLAACPNCGYESNALEKARLLPAEHVLIDRWALRWRSLKRGEVVAFQAPGGDLAIKRVAGLPGEKLAIQGGDLYAGEQLIRKNRSELYALRMLVYDNHHQPRKTSGLADRWRGSKVGTGWQKTETGFRIEASDGEAPHDWLEYVHWPCTADARTRGLPSPILDNDSYNQGETKRSLNSVADVMLSCRLRTTGSGWFTLAAADGDQRFHVGIEAPNRLTYNIGHVHFLRPIQTDFSRRDVQIEFGLCDRQLLLVIDGRTVIRHDYERAAGPRTEPLHPLSIGAKSIGLQIDDLCVWRDIHYLDPYSLPRKWEAAEALQAGEFALMGDNQPVSVDSRHWELPGIPRNKIWGHVYRPFWTAK